MKTLLNRYVYQQPIDYGSWGNNNYTSREVYMANKRDFFTFIFQACSHYQLKPFMTFKVLSLIECFFTSHSTISLNLNLNDMKMICLGCLSIILKLHEYRGIALSLISSIGLTRNQRLTVNEITMYELIVLREFNYEIIGNANNSLTLFSSLIGVNNYYFKSEDYLRKILQSIHNRFLANGFFGFVTKITHYHHNSTYDD